MIGRAEVARRRQQLDATFLRGSSLPQEPEILSDFARYLCILVSGYLEQSVIEILLEYTRKNSNGRVQKNVESRLRQLTNLKTKRMIDTLGSFDSAWAKSLEVYLVDEYKDAVNSIVDLRNAISHGRYEGITMHRMGDYYVLIKAVVDRISQVCV
jgi:hypothetical protein